MLDDLRSELPSWNVPGLTARALTLEPRDMGPRAFWKVAFDQDSIRGPLVGGVSQNIVFEARLNQNLDFKATFRKTRSTHRHRHRIRRWQREGRPSKALGDSADEQFASSGWVHARYWVSPSAWDLSSAPRPTTCSIAFSSGSPEILRQIGALSANPPPRLGGPTRLRGRVISSSA